MPGHVVYHASWVDAKEMRCYQVMEAESAEALQPWIAKWKDLVEFEIVAVETSQEFWGKIGGK